MTKEQYRKYLSSEEWIARRGQFLRVWNFCNRCDLPRWLAIIAYNQDLHVHHRHYMNMGNERPEDLEALCKRCHGIETFGGSNLPSIRPEICPSCGGNNYDRYSMVCIGCSAVRDHCEREVRRAVVAVVAEEKGNGNGKAGGS